MSADAPKAAVPPRLIFLDVTRAAAITMMVFAHFTDQLLEPARRAGALGALYEATRGFTAPMFFVVSGWSFALVVQNRPNLPRRLRRAGLLVLIGYALTLPWWAEGFPFAANPEVWPPFWTGGVLHAVGVALAVASLIRWCSSSFRGFVVACAVLAPLTVALGPWLQAQAARWPVALRGYFEAGAVAGGFPLAPWAGFFFAGAALGGALALLRASRTRRVVALLAVAGAAALLQWVLPVPHQLLLLRFAAVAATLAVAALLPGARLPASLQTLSGHALTFYVVHMVALWGAPFIVGLVHRFGPTLGWGECVALSCACLGATGLGLHLGDWGWGRASSAYAPGGAGAFPSTAAIRSLSRVR